MQLHPDIEDILISGYVCFIAGGITRVAGGGILVILWP
jgi:hypothetical protein